MDAEYECLLASTRHALRVNLRKEPHNAPLLNKLLIDCGRCINKSIHLLKEGLSQTEVCIEKLSRYLSDAGTLLQSLSEFTKMLEEFSHMKCCGMKEYPTESGKIILTVFTHCKDSESLYGNNLVNVEKELKDLFKNCQELQLNYLRILEKQFEFDLSKVEEKKILFEALAINLEISESVQTLDMKTLAVQWKAYINICEKYSNALSDTSIFEDCLKVLCSIIKMKIQSAVEANDPKIAPKLLKVTNFLLKTLQKNCIIFKHSSKKNYENVVNLLFYINMCRCCILEMTVDRVQFVNLVVIPSDCLLRHLLLDEVFANNFLNYDVESLKKENLHLGFVVSIASVMECLVSLSKGKSIITKTKIINCLYDILPQCNSDVWGTQVALNVEDPNQTHRLFEHLLTRTAALAFTLTGEEFCLLERNMVDAVLSTNCAGSLFSANLWVLILMASNINPQLLFTQIVWLCTMFNKLEKCRMFHRSPQKLHLSYTINRLFELMENDDKLKICKQFRMHDDYNISLWAALGVVNLPCEAQNMAEKVVNDKLKAQFQSLSCGEDVERFTKLMTLAASCDFTNTSMMEHITMKAWSKTCHKNQFSVKHVIASTVWFYDYLKALVALTESLWHKLSLDNGNLVKILHFVTILIQFSAEYRLLFIDILCKIASSNISRSIQTDGNFTQAFTCLSQDAEEVRSKLFMSLKQYRNDKNMENVLSNVKNDCLRDSWSKIRDGQDLNIFENATIDFKYIHKCFESKRIESRVKAATLEEASIGNFEFEANVDDLFENDNEYDLEVPLPKKVKLENSEAEEILNRMDSDVALLCSMKENVSLLEYRDRIQNVCNMLNNIITQ